MSTSTRSRNASAASRSKKKQTLPVVEKNIAPKAPKKARRRPLAAAAKKKPSKPARKPKEKFGLGPATHSEHEQHAAAEGTGRGGRFQFSLDYSHGKCQLQISLGGKPWVQGEWELHAAFQNRELVADGEWQHVCWEVNKTTAFLEIARSLTHGWSVSRQIAFSPADGILLLADAVMNQPAEDETHSHAAPLATPAIASVQSNGAAVRGAMPELLSYVGTLPLAANVVAAPAVENSEMILARKQSKMVVMPLALPEWRSALPQGSLVSDEAVPHSLQYRVQRSGHALYAPLWLDLQSRRARGPYTWRHLTVAENLEKVSDNIATGYRIQSGREQWLVYRSLLRRGNRTVLGHNTICDFALGQFTKQGDFKPLVEIE